MGKRFSTKFHIVKRERWSSLFSGCPC